MQGDRAHERQYRNSLQEDAQTMNEPQHPIFQLLQADSRYQLDAYQFVRDALGFAQDELGMGQKHTDPVDEEPPEEAHLTGQQLCEAIRQYAIKEYGLMAKIVLNRWGVQQTGDFGNIVYNLIQIGLMRKSDSDRREDFDNVYDFEDAFNREFRITQAE